MLSQKALLKNKKPKGLIPFGFLTVSNCRSKKLVAVTCLNGASISREGPHYNITYVYNYYMKACSEMAS